MMGGGDVDQFEVFLQDDVSAADDCVHISDFEPEKDKLVIRFDEPIEQAANPDRVIMTYDSRADATNVLPMAKRSSKSMAFTPTIYWIFILAISHASPKSLRNIDVVLAINLRIGGIILLIP